MQQHLTKDQEEIIQSILRETLCTAVLIDDDFANPYEEYKISKPTLLTDEKENSTTSDQIPVLETSDLQDEDKSLTPQKRSKEIFESFREEKCSLEIFRYDNAQWIKIKDHILRNRDLLILDWKLSNDSFEDALRILKLSVETDSLPFVLIYTGQTTDARDVIYNIYRYLGREPETYKEQTKKFEEIFGQLDLNQLKSLKNEFKELITSPVEELTDHVSEIKELIYQRYEPKVFGPMLGKVKKMLNTKDETEVLKFIGYEIDDTGIDPSAKYSITSVQNSDNLVYVNNTIIGVLKKYEVKAKDVYKNFVDFITKHPKWLLTLFAMEMKNFYREKFGAIGKDLIELNQNAFLFHYKNLKKQKEKEGETYFKEDFRSFILNHWKNQISAAHFSFDSKIFGEIDALANKVLSDDKLISDDKLKIEDNLMPEFIKLNHLYSFSHYSISNKKYFSFGDLFTCESEEGKNSPEKFVLCITPHCDCIRPKRLNNQLLFVMGEKECSNNKRKALREAESGHYSFLIHNESPICIKWKLKPFSIWIPPEIKEFSNHILVKHPSIKSLKFIGNQLENFTQRIANAAFSDASRVGVEFACFGSKEQTEGTSCCENNREFWEYIKINHSEILDSFISQKTEGNQNY